MALWEDAKLDLVYVSQADAENIARGEFGQIDRKRVRTLHKTWTGNNKLGPVPSVAKLRQELRAKKNLAA